MCSSLFSFPSLQNQWGMASILTVGSPNPRAEAGWHLPQRHYTVISSFQTTQHHRTHEPKNLEGLSLETGNSSTNVACHYYNHDDNFILHTSFHMLSWEPHPDSSPRSLDIWTVDVNTSNFVLSFWLHIPKNLEWNQWLYWLLFTAQTLEFCYYRDRIT